jgi:hypothetical protein
VDLSPLLFPTELFSVRCYSRVGIETSRQLLAELVSARPSTVFLDAAMISVSSVVSELYVTSASGMDVTNWDLDGRVYRLGEPQA